MIGRIKRHTGVFAALLSLCSAAVLPRILRINYDDTAISCSFLCILFAAGMFFLLRHAFDAMNRRLFACAAAPAFLISLCLTVGRDVAMRGEADFSLRGICLNGTAALLFTPALFGLIACLFAASDHLKPLRLNSREPLRRKTFLIVWGVLFLCWIPAFLAYYPGILSYDTNLEISQFFGDQPFLMNTPPLHVVFLCLWLKIGEVCFHSFEIGAALHSVVQMLLTSAAYAYCCMFIRHRLKAGNLLFLISVGFFALFPMHAMMAVSSVKDTLYTASMLVIAVLAAEVSLDADMFFADKKRVAFLIGFCTLLCLWRNNGVIPLAFLAVGALFACKRRWRLTAAIALGIALALLGNNLYRYATDAQPVEKKELFAIPIQITGRIVTLHDGELTAAEDALVAACFRKEKLLQYYEPLLADTARWSAYPIENAGDGLEMLRCAVTLAAHYPQDALNAVALLTLGYWYPDDISMPEAHSTIFSTGQGYMQTYENALTPTIQVDSKLPKLHAFLEDLFADGDGYQKLPIFATLCVPASHFWLLITACFLLLYRKQNSAFLMPALLLGTVLNCLLGPCAASRYAYPVIVAMPLLIAFVTAVCREPHHAETASDGAA